MFSVTLSVPLAHSLSDGEPSGNHPLPLPSPTQPLPSLEMAEPPEEMLFVASHFRRPGSLAPAARRVAVIVALGAALVACIGMVVARGGSSARPAALFGIYIPSMDADSPHSAELREEVTGRRPDLQEHLDQVLAKARTTLGSVSSLAPENTPIRKAPAVELYNPSFDADNPAVARKDVAHEAQVLSHTIKSRRAFYCLRVFALSDL